MAVPEPDDAASAPATPSSRQPDGPVTQCFLKLAGMPREETTSGHTPLQMLQFSMSLAGPFLCTVVLSSAREFYTLIFGADADAMGTALLVISFWGPVIYPLVGHLQDKEKLARVFPPSKWGRRSPWFLVHLLGLSLCSALLYSPPSQEPVTLVAWLVPVLVMGTWCLVNIFVAFESSRAELYPMKGERVLIESMNKVTVGFGSGVGGALMILLLGDVPVEKRIAISAAIGVCSLMSLVALPIYFDAKKAADRHLIGNFITEWMEVLRGDAVKQHSMLKFWQGAMEATVLTFIPYHLTFNAKVVGSDRQGFIALAAFVVILVEVVLLPVFTRKFRAGKWDMQRVCCWAHATCAPVAPLLLAFLPLEMEWNILVYIVVMRLCFAPQTYFRTNSLCWIVDEDCFQVLGRRREGTFIGVTSFIGSLGRAAAAGILFKGMTMAGLKTANCLKDCDHYDAQSRAFTDCVDLCETANADSQPESVRTYIDVMFYGVIPLCQTLSAFHIFLFPIKGGRLQRLCEMAKTGGDVKAQAFGNISLPEESAKKSSTPVEPVVSKAPRAEEPC